MEGNSEQDRIKHTQEFLKVLFEISKVLNTGLDEKSLYTCVRLCEGGVHPDCVAKLVFDMRKDVKSYAELKAEQGAKEDRPKES